MKFLKRLAPFAVIALAAFLLVELPDIGPERYTDLAAFFRTELGRQAYSGYAVAIVKDGSLLYVDAFGRDGAGAPLAVDTPLCIGALSKSFAGFAALSLAREGKLDLDAPVRTYLPWFSFASGGAGGDGAAVTPRHLLSHTSGVSDRDFDDVHSGALDLDSAVRVLSSAVPRAAPGVETHYLNTDYQALGLVLEKASGLPYDELLATRVFAPLGMGKSSAAPGKVSGAVPPGNGSFFGAPVPRRQALLPFGAPSGYLVSTAEDLGRYLAFLAAPEKYKKKPPLAVKAVPVLFTPLMPPSPYAFGWRIEGEGPDLRASHGGSLEAYSAEAAVWPAERAAVVVVAAQNSLLQSLVSMPALIEGAHSLIREGSAARPLPLQRLYILLAVTAVVHLLVLALQTGFALGWARDVRCRAEAQGGEIVVRLARFRAVFGVIVRGALFAATPIVLTAVFGRRVSWAVVFQLEPGLAGWLVVACFFGILRNLTRLAWLRGPRQPAGGR